MIVSIETQVSFAEHRSQPDLLLRLADGRCVACEHKLDAAETSQKSNDGAALLQLERYLNLPGVDAVAYFRTSLKPPADEVLKHPRYLRPADAPHYLWRDLYEPLGVGDHPICSWLLDGFERLGFTPPHPHVGALRPHEDPQVQENQRNFGKLWHNTRSHLAEHWKITTGSRCELYLEPKAPAAAQLVYISPLAQGGTLLRVRVSKIRESYEALRSRLERIAAALPVQPEVVNAKAGDGTPCVDLLASLRLVLGDENDTARQESRLFAQVVPVIEAVRRDS